MPFYRFYFLDDDGEVHDVRAVEARKDSFAIERADQFLAVRSDHVAIEIWKPQGFVKGIRRDGRHLNVCCFRAKIPKDVRDELSRLAGQKKIPSLHDGSPAGHSGADQVKISRHL